MNTMEARLEEIRQLLSHLHGEVTALESNYTSVLKVLRKFENASERDDLTGLLRRAAFFEATQDLVKTCQRSGQTCGVMILDIDHFKRVNDTHGHPTGDEVIKAVAGLLGQYQTQNCVAGRIGGEEFAVAFLGSNAEMIGLAEFIRRGAERLHGPVIGNDGQSSSTVEWKCTISIGVSPLSTQLPGTDPEAAIKVAMTAADAALYQAKRRGRNQVCAA